MASETTSAQQPNLAETLARVLPKAEVLPTMVAGGVYQVAVPAGTTLKEIDTERLLDRPRRAQAMAMFSDAESFLAYAVRHADESSVVWCTFDPQVFSLAFRLVVDEHAKDAPGWRTHTADFKPELAAEWKAWKTNNGQAMAQVKFAEWLQEHEDDITSTSASLPTSLQMHAMATEFVANEERLLKSTVKLQSGGVRLTYIADPDAGTTESMQMFERFAIGIPVLHDGSAWSITARLKYRLNAGKVSFHYELVRPDRVHEGAAKEMIERIRSGLGSVPLLMGSCT